jgi:hypothetical protein
MLVADRPVIQRSLFDPHEDEDRTRHEDGVTQAPEPRGERPGTGLASGPDGRTLDDLVTATWQQLVTARTATCLVCGGEVRPRWSAGPHPVGGVCRTCGTEIA